MIEMVTHEGGTDVKPNRLDQSESCPVFKIEQETQDGNLTIVNDAGSSGRTYFYGTKSGKEPGLWMISGPYKGKYLEREMPTKDNCSHGKFLFLEKMPDESSRILNGNAQILKAVDEYMILTICTEQEQETQIYSFILVRQVGGTSSLPSTDFFDYVNNLLERKRLDVLHTARFLCSTNTLKTTTESRKMNSEEQKTGSSACTVLWAFYLKMIMVFVYKVLA